MIFLTQGVRTLKEKISIWGIFLVSTLVGMVFFPFVLLRDALNPSSEEEISYFDEDEEEE